MNKMETHGEMIQKTITLICFITCLNTKTIVKEIEV